ncbi:MAG: hypothetical protein J6K29_08140 [Clostridia bacterium]|nr:hypothetical protein [Clostridia bacterium]
MKLVTPFGRIVICVDGDPTEYAYQEKQPDPRWYVDGRYWIRVSVPGDGLCHTVACLVECPLGTNAEQDSGEGVEMVCFRQEPLKMEIGIFEANDDHGTEYVPNGIAYTVHSGTDTREMIFGVAWLCRVNRENEDHTWFACDPTLP